MQKWEFFFLFTENSAVRGDILAVMGKKIISKKRQSNLDGNWCFFSVLGKWVWQTANFTETRLTRRVK